MSERKKIGLALSGGGIKGIAHVGVLRVLEDYKIPIDFISGTSIGALIGAMYAAQPNAKKLEKDVLSEDIGKLIDYTLSKYGLIKGNKIEEYLEKKLNNIEFKDLKIPLFITAFDIDKKREIIFSKGDVSKAVRASISIPGIFVPVENNNKILVDAGLVDPIPTEILKKVGADIIIAVNVNIVKERAPIYNEKATLKKGKKKLPSMLDSTMRSLNVISSETSKADLQSGKADFIINVDLENVTLLDYKKTKIALEKGKRAAKKCLEEIKNVNEPRPFKTFLDELNTGVETIVKQVQKAKKAIQAASPDVNKK